MADPLLFACLNAKIAVHYQPSDAGYDAAKVVKNRRSDIVPSRDPPYLPTLGGRQDLKYMY